MAASSSGVRSVRSRYDHVPVSTRTGQPLFDVVVNSALERSIDRHQGIAFRLIQRASKAPTATVDRHDPIQSVAVNCVLVHWRRDTRDPAAPNT